MSVFSVVAFIYDGLRWVFCWQFESAFCFQSCLLSVKFTVTGKRARRDWERPLPRWSSILTAKGLAKTAPWPCVTTQVKRSFCLFACLSLYNIHIAILHIGLQSMNDNDAIISYYEDDLKIYERNGTFSLHYTYFELGFNTWIKTEVKGRSESKNHSEWDSII